MVWQLQKKNHVGLIVQSPDKKRCWTCSTNTPRSFTAITSPAHRRLTIRRIKMPGLRPGRQSMKGGCGYARNRPSFIIFITKYFDRLDETCKTSHQGPCPGVGYRAHTRRKAALPGDLRLRGKPPRRQRLCRNRRPRRPGGGNDPMVQDRPSHGAGRIRCHGRRGRRYESFDIRR